MSASANHRPYRFWIILFAGALLAAALGMALHNKARENARAYAMKHAVAQGEGMLMWLYDNPFLTGKPQKHILPAPRLHKDHTPRKAQRKYPFSWRWLACLDAPVEGEYIFDIHAAEALRLRIDGQPVIQCWIGYPDRHQRALVRLSAGPHLIDLENVQEKKRLDLSLLWAPPGADRERIIPDSRLRPLNDMATNQGLTKLNRAVERGWALTWLLPILWIALCLLALKDPGRTLRAFREHGWFLLILALGSILRLAWGDVVHGVSGEEAYFGNRARLILEGGLPFNGMTERTGPLFDYLLALPWAVFGPSAWLLRVMCAIPNILAIVFCYRVFDREGGRATALAASLLFSVIPATVVFARMPGDNTALGPLMLFMGLDMLSMSRANPPWAVLAGVVWGLACYNHSIFVILPFTLGLGALAATRLKILAEMRIWGMGLGFIIGFAPRLWDRLAHSPRDVMSFTDPDRMSHLGFFMEMFGSTLDGELTYRTFVGQYAWDTAWIAPMTLIAASLFLIWGLVARRDEKSWIEVTLLTALAVHLVMAPLGAPTANTRYFLYCLIFAALIMGRAWGRAVNWSGPAVKKAAAASLIAFAAFCTASLGVNYFHAHLSSGGNTGFWDTPLLDHTPDAWMNHKLLAQALAEKGYPVVATADRWHHTLDLALNLYQGEPPAFMARPFTSFSDTERAAVFYNSPEGKHKAGEFLRGHSNKRFKQVSLGPELDKKYILFEKVSPKVPYPTDWKEAK